MENRWEFIYLSILFVCLLVNAILSGSCFQIAFQIGKYRGLDRCWYLWRRVALGSIYLEKMRLEIDKHLSLKNSVKKAYEFELHWTPFHLILKSIFCKLHRPNSNLLPRNEVWTHVTLFLTLNIKKFHQSDYFKALFIMQSTSS